MLLYWITVPYDILYMACISTGELVHVIEVGILKETSSRDLFDINRTAI